MKSAKAFTDGSGNSARIQACAAVLYVGQEKFSRARLLPPHTTNNVGEYRGILLALELAHELGVEDLQIFSDSKLIVHQLRGEWRCNNYVLATLRDRARKKAEIFRKAQIEWVPREKNKEADSLCRSTIKAALRIRAPQTES